jgi:hypothetical protein
MSVFSVAAAFYLISLSGGIDFGDGATFVSRAVDFHLEARATEHPLYYLFCRGLLSVPFGSMAWRVNLASAIPAALCLTIMCVFLKEQGLGLFASLFGVAAYGFSHAFWLKASVPDVYALQDCLAAATFYCVFKWKRESDIESRRATYWLLAWGASWGLCLTHHFLLAFLLPGQILFVLMNRKNISSRYKFVLWFAAAFLATSFVWWYTAITQILDGDSVIAIFTGGGDVESKVGTASPLKALPRSIALFAYQYPWLLIPIGLCGAAFNFKRGKETAWMLFTGFCLSTLFAVTYKSHHSYEVFSQSYLIFALWIAYGAQAALDLPWNAARRKLAIAILTLNIALQPITYYATCSFLSARPATLPVRIRALPHRDPVWHFLWPPKTGWNGAERYGREVMESLPRRSVIVADWTLFTVLRYMREVEGLRPDVEIVFLESKDVESCLKEYPDRPIFVADDDISYRLGALTPPCVVKKKGLVFEIQRTR